MVTPKTEAVLLEVWTFLNDLQRSRECSSTDRIIISRRLKPMVKDCLKKKYDIKV